MVQFSAEFIIAKDLGTQGREYPNVKMWLDACRETDSYQRAMKKTGHEV
jgi:glutathione S-transferase